MLKIISDNSQGSIQLTVEGRLAGAWNYFTHIERESYPSECCLGVQNWNWSIFAVTAFGVAVLMMMSSHAQKSFAQNSPVQPEVVSGLPKGTGEMNAASGYTYAYRRTDAHVTKLRGVPVILGSGRVVTDPIGTSWYRGQATVGGELLFTQYVEPLTTYLVALTPTMKYTFLTSDRLRPYVEAGAGVVWTDLGNRIPEKGSQFNFNLQVGVGIFYAMTPSTWINLGYRIQHISNAGTADPNHGIDAGMALVGISKYF